MELDYLAIDADHHYYEPLDAFTRHLDPAFRTRGVQVVTQGRRTYLVIGDRINRFVPNPTFDPIVVAGCLDPLFRGQIPEGVDPRSLMQVEPLRREYQHRAERLEVMARQGLEGVLMFPTLGCGVEEALTHDVGATMASLSAFNRWLDDDWGFTGPIIGVPMLSLADPEAAVAEIDWLVSRGARIVHVRPAPVPGPNGTSRSPGDRHFDAVWARLAEADLPVAFHLGDSGYEAQTTQWGGTGRFEGFGNVSTLTRVLVADRAIHDTMAALIIGKVFDRHPNLRVASIENGSDWVHLLVKRLRKQANQTPWSFAEDPLETVRRHIWMTPYYEEDFAKLADLIGVERILFGSDWPHGEGMAEPLLFTKELEGFSPDDVHKVMRTNVLDLLGVTQL